MNPSMPRSHAAARAPRLGRTGAFTVTELLVVIVLISILVLIAVPSFQSMVYSSEEALAETQLRGGIRAARDVAVRSSAGNDGAAVIFFDRGGRTTILPCVKAGELVENLSGPSGVIVLRREVFAPAGPPVQLPRNFMLRGYLPPQSVTSDFYGNSAASTGYSPNQAAWAFPETDFFNAESTDAGLDRNTFLVRFEAGTGALVGASTEPVLVFAPRRSSAGRQAQPFSDFRADRDGVEDPVRFVKRVLSAPTLSSQEKVRLLGRESSDIVMARPVQQIALYDESRLASALRARIDPDTGAIYAAPPQSGDLQQFGSYAPRYVPAQPQDISIDRINDWIEGDTDLDGRFETGEDGDRPLARLYSVDRYTGALRSMPVQPKITR